MGQLGRAIPGWRHSSCNLEDEKSASLENRCKAWNKLGVSEKQQEDQCQRRAGVNSKEWALEPETRQGPGYKPRSYSRVRVLNQECALELFRMYPEMPGVLHKALQQRFSNSEHKRITWGALKKSWFPAFMPRDWFNSPAWRQESQLGSTVDFLVAQAWVALRYVGIPAGGGRHSCVAESPFVVLGISSDSKPLVQSSSFQLCCPVDSPGALKQNQCTISEARGK